MNVNKRIISVCVFTALLFVGWFFVFYKTDLGSVSQRTPDVLSLGRRADTETYIKQSETNQKIWRDLNIVNYAYDVEVISLCPELYFEYEYPTTIVVRNAGSSVSLVDENSIKLDGHALECMRGFDSINRIIVFTRSAIQPNPDYIKIKYDPVYGIPTEIDIDQDVNELDDTLHLFISRFVVLNEN